jgi:hypothetical protein
MSFGAGRVGEQGEIMQYVKTLVVAVAAAIAVMSFVGAGAASASVICSTTTTPCTSPWANGTVMDFSLVGTSKTSTTENSLVQTCTGGTLKGTLTQGTPTVTAKIAITVANLTWSGCTFTTDTISGGAWEIHNISGTSNGTVTAKEVKYTVNTALFGTCVFSEGSGIDLGTLTEGKAGTASSPDATIHINAVTSRESGLCPATEKWEATYVLTEPKETTLSVSAS